MKGKKEEEIREAIVEETTLGKETSKEEIEKEEVIIPKETILGEKKEEEIPKVEVNTLLSKDEADYFQLHGRVAIGKEQKLPEQIFAEPKDPNVPFAKLVYNPSVAPIEIPDIKITLLGRELMDLTRFKTAQEINASVHLRNAITIFGVKVVKDYSDLTPDDLARMDPLLESLTPGAIYDAESLLSKIGEGKNPHIVNLKKYEEAYDKRELRRIKGVGPGILAIKE